MSTLDEQLTALSGKGDAGLAYLSCRHCPEGRERAQGVANDNGGGR